MERKLIIETGGELHMPQKAESTGEGRWTASVWKLDKKNLNGRTYSTALAQRLVKEDARTLAYDGHEAQYASGGEYAIAKAVCSHPRIEDGELRVDIDFVDEAYERMLQSLMAKGIAIGVMGTSRRRATNLCAILTSSLVRRERSTRGWNLKGEAQVARMGRRPGPRRWRSGTSLRGACRE